MKEEYKKTYVDVFLVHTRDGIKSPRFILMNDGVKIEIDKVVSTRRAASTKVGGNGMRYTIRIGQNERYLFEDEAGWFVEGKVSSEINVI